MERAIAAQGQALIELWQADEDQGEQRFAVPAIIEQNVQMIERVLVQQVSLVYEEDREDPFASEVLDMTGDGEEDVASGGAVGTLRAWQRWR